MPNTVKYQAIVAYIPVIHRGYLQLFHKFRDVKKLYLLGNDYIKQLDYPRKDLRALKPSEVVDIVSSLKLFEVVELLGAKSVAELDRPEMTIVMPDEDVSRIAKQSFKHAKVIFFPIFLRWDRRAMENVNKSDPAETTSSKQIDKQFMKQALEAAESSSDIWRRVGAVIVDKKGKVVSRSSSLAEPTQTSPWIEGDPRIHSNIGVALEISVFTHAEAVLIATAAKNGTSLSGGSMYVTTFPCPACAKLIAHSGIKHVYYKDGYAILDGRRVLNDYKVVIKRVKIKDLPNNSDTWVPYPKKS